MPGRQCEIGDCTPSVSRYKPETMKGSLCESTQWAAGLAARLRYLQSSLATELSETRERTLSKELAKALKPVAPEKRRQFLENLVAQFPVPDAFHVRCQLEAGHRQLSADKEAALKAIAERDAALEGLQSQIAAYASQLQALGEERDTLVQARERDVDSLSPNRGRKGSGTAEHRRKECAHRTTASAAYRARQVSLPPKPRNSRPCGRSVMRWPWAARRTPRR